MARRNILRPELEPHQRALALMIDAALKRGQRGDGDNEKHWTPWNNRSFADASHGVFSENAVANWRDPARPQTDGPGCRSGCSVPHLPWRVVGRRCAPRARGIPLRRRPGGPRSVHRFSLCPSCECKNASEDAAEGGDEQAKRAGGDDQPGAAGGVASIFCFSNERKLPCSCAASRCPFMLPMDPRTHS